ncbi:MAG TPA: hypothetical protein IAA12_06395 [Candidatus Blautia intestinipullorum]|nr:hypothetical protein [Candidatus Blautia intestinipullorum]
MMKKRNRGKRNVQVLAAAALTAALIAGQTQPLPVQGSSEQIQVSSLIPDNVTIEHPVPLSEVSLPGSDYGTLSWVDSSSIPSGRVQSYDVVFYPYDSSDLAKISGWDGVSDGIYSSVTVVVTNPEGSEVAEDTGENDYSDEEYTEESGGDSYDDSYSGEEDGGGFYEEGQESESTGEESETEITEEPEITEAPEAEATPEPEETPEITEAPGAEATPEPEETPEITEAPEAEETPEPEETPEITEAPEAEATPEPEETPEISETPEATPTPEITETPAATPTPEAAETPEVSVTPDPAEEPEEDKNIFDRDKESEKDTRPDEFEDDLTEEEKAAAAAENHTCNGISVSGINLPWYVQFRVSSGDDYEFTNETEANIFKSYEFELWDLKNDTEYHVPDGEYISVTVPVKAGYEYTIEHLLDNGAMETIVPSVDGSTMVFSTHSFSPFGIAGSKPLVGEEIASDGYEDTSESQATATPSAAASSAAENNRTENTVTSAASGSDNSGSQSSSQTTADQNETDTSVQEDSSDSTDAVNTGDSTPIAPFVILAAAAVVTIAVIIYLRKRK